MFDIKNYCYEHGLGSDEQNDPSLFLTMGKTGARGEKPTHVHEVHTEGPYISTQGPLSG